ncbi:hypothetical protein UFOVP71_84 [uncultured Caudovirales phage]|uniref:Uncharacterized protein n=1 Tax=uncultured Caudovirales phage TaxID=2100421 RepID=A0A6J5T9H8_9CAUD|nr:hypothetical protein UFOVP71_84 [uncultured Caudovirales phage]
MRIIELEQPIINDIIEFETDPDTVVEGRIIAETEDGYIYEFSEQGLKELVESCTHGKYFCSTDKVWKCRQGPKQSRQVKEEDKEDPCWDGYHQYGMKDKGGKKVPNCVPEAANPAQQAAIAIHKKEEMDEAEYQGREVPLGKPMKGDVKKSKVYVRNEKGNVVKVNFGDPNMRIKKNSPAHRKSFRARHHCENPGPRTSARYWSCRAW